MQELVKIQSELKAPKNQRNNFGNYNYRSCEDILEGLKPLLAENNCTLVISDDIVQIGDRYYVKATCEITNSENIRFKSVAFAREPLDKKGMDQAQITGSTSSYARKYALNGLFCIDDTKDADTMKAPEPVARPKAISDYPEIIKKFNNCGTMDELKNIFISLDARQKQLFNAMKDEIKAKLEGIKNEDS